jgi:hypothetical protein
MKKINFILLAISILVLNAQAQELKVKWSEKMTMKTDKSLDGFFSSFLGENDKYLYAYFNKYKHDKIVKGKKPQKIVAFDKKTMKKKSAVELIDYPVNNNESKKYKKFSYYKTLVFNDVIYFFYTGEKGGSKHLLVKGYSDDLKLQKPLTLVTSVPLFNKKQKNKPAVPFVIGNSKLKKIIVGIENEAIPESDIKLKYQILNSDFSFSKSNTITLPIKYKSKPKDRLYAYSYRLEKNNKFYFNANSMEYRVDLQSKKVKNTSIYFKGKKTRSISKRTVGSQTKIFGFYEDRSKDKKVTGIDGVFHAVLNDNHELENVVFSRFSKKLLNKMFQNSNNKRKKSRQKFFNISSDSNYGSINLLYNLEDVVLDKDGSIYLISTIVFNSSRQKCKTSSNGSQICTTVITSRNTNVTVFKLTNKGEIEWGINHDREINYSLWSINDIKAVHDNNSLYIIYGAKPQKGRTRSIEYIQVSKKDGKTTKKLLDVNNAETPKKVTKRIIPGFYMKKIDNKVFVYHTKKKSEGFYGVIELK